MKRICGLILIFTMFFSVASFAFATEDVCPMVAKPNPIKCIQK